MKVKVKGFMRYTRFYLDNPLPLDVGVAIAEELEKKEYCTIGVQYVPEKKLGAGQFAIEAYFLFTGNLSLSDQAIKGKINSLLMFKLKDK